MTSGKMEGEDILIRSVAEAWEEYGVQELDLLHANCEGCEWELMETILDSGLAGKIRIITLGTHWFRDIHNIEAILSDPPTVVQDTQNGVWISICMGTMGKDRVNE